MLPVEELGLPTSAAGAAGAATTDDDDSEDDFRYEEEEVEAAAADWSTAGPDRPPPGPVGLSDHEFLWYERWLQRRDMVNKELFQKTALCACNLAQMLSS